MSSFLTGSGVEIELTTDNLRERRSEAMTAEDLLDPYDEEGGSPSQERDWKGLITALFVILMICLLIGLCLVLFTPLTGSSLLKPKKMNISDMRTLRYPYAEFQFTSKSQGAVVMQGWEGVEMVENGFSALVFGRENGVEIVPSHDLSYFATLDKTENPGMNPSNDSYHLKIVNDKDRITNDIGLKPEESEVQAFMWNGNRTDFVFVENGKIYYKTSPESKDTVRVSNGEGNTVDGLFEWLYEEEIFTKKEALWWSQDGSKLAYASYDNHLTRNVSLKSYHKLSAYTIDSYLHYPKTFAKLLPTYTLSIWDKYTEEAKQMDVQLKNSTSYQYLYAVKWLEINGVEKLISIWTNRYQNHVSLTICDYSTAICQLEFEYKYADKRWASHEDFNSMVSYNGSLYFILPHDMETNSYQHIAKLKVGSGQQHAPKYYSLGDFDVCSIEGINPKSDILYFHAAAPQPQYRNLFSLNLKVSNAEPECVTCHVSNCSYIQAMISDDYDKALIQCKGPEAPHAVVMDITETEKMGFKNASYDELLTDRSYQSRVEDIGLPVIIHDKVKIDDDYEALIKLSIPQEVHARDKHRPIPLLVHVYGGPNDQNTKDSTQMGIEEFVSTNQQVAILRIDGRGSGGRGWKYRSAIYGRLGTVEVEDQIKVIKSVLKSYRTLLDSSRVAVFGWSYGGFMSLSMVEEAPEHFFKCAISVAPVTNFAYYDATYTERYMGDAPIEAYSDVTKKLDNFKTTRLLLMHGLLDDNVHFQNSAILIEELQTRGIDFELMVYPNQAHSISSRIGHVTGKLSHFLKNCFAS